MFAPGAGATSYANDGLNRVKTVKVNAVTYDAKSNIASALGSSYDYNGLNELTSANGTGYDLDTQGRLFQAGGRHRANSSIWELKVGDYGASIAWLDARISDVFN